MVRCTTSAANATLDGISMTQLGTLLGVHATTATLAFFITSQFKLTKVRMWCTPNAIGNTIQIGLKWADSPLAASVGIANPPVVVEDVSNSIEKPAYVCLSPKRGTLSDNWFGTGATATLLYVSQSSSAGNPTSVIDFFFDWILDDIGSTGNIPIVAGTAGVFYHKIITGTLGLVYTPIPPLNSI